MSNSKKGKVFESKILALLQEKSELFINNNQKLQAINKAIPRIKVRGMTVKSHTRGDILYKDDTVFIFECKNYERISSMLKPQSLMLKNKINYVKTCDSNVKTFFNNNMFALDISKYEQLKQSFCDRKPFSGSSIKRDDFISMLNFFEYGYQSLLSNNFNKYYIFKSRNSLKLCNVNLNKIIGNITIKLIIEKNYSYLNFYDRNNLIYSVSTRDNSKANSAFISKDILNQSVFTSEEQLAQTIFKIVRKKISLPKITQRAIELIKEFGELKSKELSLYIYNIFRDEIQLRNPHCSREQILIRIKKDLNPSFKKICKECSISYEDKLYLKD